MSGLVQFTGLPVLGTVFYSCATGQPVIELAVEVENHTKFLAVSPGDMVRTELVSAAGPGKADMSAEITDLTNGGTIKEEWPDPSIPTGILGAMEGNTTTGIPPFGAVQFSNVKFNGASFSTLPELVQLVMINAKRQPMIKTGALWAAGTGFNLHYLRN
jgi:hypothetical protein